MSRRAMRRGRLLGFAAMWAFNGGARADEPDLFDLPLEALMQINVVSPSQSSRSIIRAPSSITAVSAEQIRAMGARTLGDLLKMLPGIQLFNRRNGLDSIWIRGIASGRNTKVLLLIDGVPQQEVIFGEWSPDEQIPLTNVERVEIIRGPGSALYGGHAYAGVISLYTRRSVPESNRISAAAGSFDSRRLEWDAGWQHGDAQWLISGSAYDSTGYPALRDRSGRASTHDNNTSDYAANARLIYRDWQAAFTISDYNTEYPSYASNQYKSQDYTFSNASLSHTAALAQGSVDSQLYAFHVDRRFDHRVLYPDGRLSFYSNSDLDTTLLGLRNQLNYRAFDVLQLTFGALLERRLVEDYHETVFIRNGQPTVEFESLIERDGDRTPDSSNYAVYAQGETMLLQQTLALTGGLRFDHFEQSGSNLSPRLGLTYQSQPSWSGKLLWGKAFRPPTLLEQFEVRSDNNSPGNPELKPELIETAEAEFTYFFGPQRTLTVRGFSSTLNAFIQTVDRRPYENVDGSVSIPGLEWEWNSRHSLGASGELGFSANVTRINTELPSVARNMANLLVFLDNRDAGLYVGANYVGRRRPSASYHSSVADPLLRATDNTGSYVVFDASLRFKQLWQSRWQVQLDVHNLFDREHFSPTQEPDAYYDVRKEPRTWELRVSYSFST